MNHSSRRGVASYQDVNITTKVSYATSLELTELLFKGLCDSLAKTEGHFARNEREERGMAIDRCLKILFMTRKVADDDVSLADLPLTNGHRRCAARFLLMLVCTKGCPRGAISVVFLAEQTSGESRLAGSHIPTSGDSQRHL